MRPCGIQDSSNLAWSGKYPWVGLGRGVGGGNGG